MLTLYDPFKFALIQKLTFIRQQVEGMHCFFLSADMGEEHSHSWQLMQQVAG